MAEAEAYDKANPLVDSEPHSCSLSTSSLSGSSGDIAYFICNICGKEWEKDIG